MMRTLTESMWNADSSQPVVNLSVGDLLREATADVPDKLALISVSPDRAPRMWTYAELLDDAEHAAAWLLARFQPGDHITVWAPNVPEWLVLQYGAALSGLVLATTNPALRGAELSYALQTSRSVGVFHADNFRGTDMSAMIAEVLPSVPSIREATALDTWLDDVRATEKLDSLPDVDPQSATQIQFTSGTTGRPKAPLLTHRGMVTNAAFVRDRCGATPGSTFATSLPLFHTAGCGLAGMGTFYHRGTLVLTEVFDPTLVLSAIQEFRAETFGGVPAMHHALLAHPDLASFDLSALQTMMSGGDAVPAELIEAWDSHAGTRFSAVYGQTELSPVVCQTSPDDASEDNQNTAGLPLPQTDVAILDPHTGTVQPIGVEGEIAARGYLRMIEYLDMPEATAATIDANGWLHTGDLGSMDDRGYVTVTGRLKDLIIRGGENIYPREVEMELVQHPGVSQAVIVGVPNEKWGESVAAVLTLVDEQSHPSAEELSSFLRERLAPHKTPTAWYLSDDLPTNAMGKLQKFRLRDQIKSGGLTAL